MKRAASSEADPDSTQDTKRRRLEESPPNVSTIFGFPLQGTLLEPLPQDIHTIISSYYYKGRPTLKETYNSDLIILGEGTEDGKFAFPTGLAIDKSGNLWVLDNGNRRLQVFDQEGDHLKTLASVADLPTVAVFSPVGDLVVVDCTMPEKIKVLDPSTGQLKFDFGDISDTKTLQNAKDIAIDNHGNFVVLDSESHRVEIFDPSGVWQWGFSTREDKGPPSFEDGEQPEAVDFWQDDGLNAPNCMALDVEGNFIIGLNNPAIKVFNQAGQLTRTLCQPKTKQTDDQEADEEGAKEEGQEIDEEEFPDCSFYEALLVDKLGRIVAVDRENCLLKIFSPDGVKIMEIGDEEGNAPGQLGQPVSAVLDKEGNLIVAEQGFNHRLQRFN